MAEASVTRIVAARETRALPPAWVAQPELDDNVPPAITEALVRAYEQAGGEVERVHFPVPATASSSSPARTPTGRRDDARLHRPAARPMKTRLLATVLVALVLLATAAPAGAGPDGQITWAVHTTLVRPTIITSFMVLCALHDGIVKPIPGKPLAPSLAESWTALRGSEASKRSSRVAPSLTGATPGATLAAP